MTGNSHKIENNIPSGLNANVSTVAPIDSTDAIIVDILEHDGRATLTRLAKASGLSVSAVQSRVQKLERRGIITGYR
ncbi:AsnC family transcriptional regulator, partial [Gardnerella vaginalis]